MKLDIDPALRADYDAALVMHGHRCPAIPLGLRLGHLARRALGVEKALDIQLLARLEIDRFHFATCLAHGVQVATGCTAGNGNLELLGWGKLGLTLLDRRRHRAVRVAPRGEVILGAKDEGPLTRCQFTGTPASEVTLDTMTQMIQMIFDMPDEQLFYADRVEENIPAPARGCDLGQCGDFKGILYDHCGRRGGRTLCAPPGQPAPVRGARGIRPQLARRRNRGGRAEEEREVYCFKAWFRTRQRPHPLLPAHEKETFHESAKHHRFRHYHDQRLGHTQAAGIAVLSRRDRRCRRDESRGYFTGQGTLLLRKCVAETIFPKPGGLSVKHFMDQALNNGLEFVACKTSLDLNDIPANDLAYELPMVGVAEALPYLGAAQKLVSF